MEAARGLLFVISQVVPAVRQFITFSDDRKMKGTLTGILYNIQLHIDTLIKALEVYDSSAANALKNIAIEPILQACLSCIAAFRHVIGMVHVNVKSLAAKADIRHTRSLQLLIYGSLCEVNNCWETLKPALTECRRSVVSYLRPATTTQIYRTRQVVPTPPSQPQISVDLMPPPLLPTPKSGELPHMFSGLPGKNINAVSTPLVENAGYDLHYSMEPADTDEQLYERVNIATLSALQVLALLNNARTCKADNVAILTRSYNCSSDPQAPWNNGDCTPHSQQAGLKLH